MAGFNQNFVEVATLNFGEVFGQSEYVFSSQLDNHKHGLGYVGYRFISAWKNFGFVLSILFCLTKLVFIVSSIILFFAKKNRRCGKLRL